MGRSMPAFTSRTRKAIRRAHTTMVAKIARESPIIDRIRPPTMVMSSKITATTRQNTNIVMVNTAKRLL